MGYVVPGCVEDGAWMLLGNSSVVASVIAVVACFCLCLYISRRFCPITCVQEWAPYMQDGDLIRPPKSESWRCASCLLVSFSSQWTFHDFPDFLFPKKMIQKCLGVVGAHPGLIPSHIRPILAKQMEHHLTNNYYNKKY